MLSLQCESLLCARQVCKLDFSLLQVTLWTRLLGFCPPSLWQGCPSLDWDSCRQSAQQLWAAQLLQLPQTPLFLQGSWTCGK